MALRLSITFGAVSSIPQLSLSVKTRNFTCFFISLSNGSNSAHSALLHSRQLLKFMLSRKVTCTMPSHKVTVG